MRASFLVAALLCALCRVSAAAPEPACEQIRVQIGTFPLADPELLRAMASRKDCAFSSAEFYRAAYGDRPLPPPEHRHPQRRHDDDDD